MILKNSGITDIKFQVHIADAESSKHEKFRKKFSLVDKTRYDYWKELNLRNNNGQFIQHCKK